MTKTDLSVSMLKANLYTLLFALPIGFLLSWFYVARWGFENLTLGFASFFTNLFYFLITFVFGIVTHEVIHAVTWMIAGKKPFSAIKFGFLWTSLTPYAHCKEPLKVNAYRIGTAMPAILLGLLPSLVAILNGNSWLIIFGVIFVIAAGGDMLILWLLRNVEKNKFVEDHPTQAGCYVLDEII
ncbi:MAG: hypothetical protein UZ14_CFX002000566 [Chloroflexi bacterium OLB14]|nr:MAG: hypothetical protein UZ14_CFX002000566 [Chloroflexi bacterium OLB14]